MKWLHNSSIFLVLLLVFVSPFLSSNTQEDGDKESYKSPKASIAGDSPVYLSPYATFYKDAEHQLSPDIIINNPELSSITTEEKAPNFGHSASVYWFKVKVQNATNVDKTQVVRLASPLADIVSFYVIKDELILDSYTTGDRAPFSIRRIPDPNPSLSVNFEANSTTTLLIRQETTSPIIFNATLSTTEVFHENHVRDMAAQMFYFGILTLIMFFSSYACWVTKETVFASYSAFIFFRLLLQASITGYAFQYLFPDMPSIQNLNLVFFSCATLACFALFTKQLFSEPGRHQVPLNLLLILSSTPIIIMFSDYRLALIVTKGLGLVSVVGFFVLAYHFSRQGLRIAKYYLLAMSLLLITSAYYLLNRFGWLPDNQALESFFYVGALIEVILLVILITIRFEQDAKQKVITKIQEQKFSEDTNLLEQQLKHRALHHSQNNLPNDVFFHQTYQELITTSGFGSHAVVFIKIHKLKEFDKTLGAHNATRLRQQLAEHINTTLRPYPSIVTLEHAHQGPIKLAAMDQTSFLFLASVDNERKVITLVRNISERLTQPFTFEAIDLNLEIHMGISFSPDMASTEKHSDPALLLDELIRKAKLAGSFAFQKKTLFQSYNEKEDLFNEARLSLAEKLKSALEQNQLTLAYQPQLNLIDKHCVGLEALLRWENPQLGPVSPEEFVSVAEHNGLIKPLTLWVINKALKEFSDINQVHKGLRFSINISVLNLHEPEFVEAVSEALNKNQIPPCQLTLEITESSIISDDQRELQTLNDLKAMGIRLSIDDFGTGFSGLAQIHKLSVHELKVDKSFILDIAQKHSAETIVKASINIAHDLDMIAVAEGIEDKETEQLVRQLGCDIGQGFYYARPMNKERIMQWLATDSRMTKIN